jgi:hypothetical protein
VTKILVKVQVQTTPQPYEEDDDYYAFKAILFQYNTETRCEDHIEVLCLVSTANQKLLGLIKSQTVMRIGRIMGAMATPMVCEGAFFRRRCCVRVVCMRHGFSFFYTCLITYLVYVLVE